MIVQMIISLTVYDCFIYTAQEDTLIIQFI